MTEQINKLAESELRLFHLVFQGLTSAEIAGQLKLAKQTVDNGIFDARTKLRRRGRKQVAEMLTQQHGWVRDVKNTLPENNVEGCSTT